MRLGFFLVAAIAAVAAAGAIAAPVPTYTLAFRGSGTEHQVDDKQNIQDSGACDSAEHVDVTATMVWSTSWPGFRPGGKSVLAAPTRIDGSRIEGTHVKDACGLPLDQAPEGWVAQSSCSDALVTSGSSQLFVVNGKKSISFALTAPPFAVPVTAQCSLNVRTDQLTAHVVVATKKLQSLKRGASLALPVGTAVPGPGDTYAPSLNCSVPTKPYEGYRTADHCLDQMSWSGSLKITRAS
jgi:hypothetical protein